MSTVRPPDEQPSVGELVRQASEHVSTLVRGEIELAKAELSGTVKRAGVGGGMLGAAGVVLLLSLPFLFVVLAEALVAIGVLALAVLPDRWVLFLLAAAVLALSGAASSGRCASRSARWRRSRTPRRGRDTPRPSMT